MENKIKDQEFLTEEEAKIVKDMFKRYLKRYKDKDPSITDSEWLEKLFKTEIPELTTEEAYNDSIQIVESINTFDANLTSINEAAKKGISKENWLNDKLQESAVGLSVHEYGCRLQGLDDILYAKNAEMSEALSVVKDGEIRINRNPNLDGILAEHMIAKTTELSGFAQGKNVRVDVLQSHNANSVDVRAINLDTGKYNNYQIKFGKDAAHTIKYIEEGNYGNQRIIVPEDQVDEVREYFKSKGSNKTITDHIEIDGVEGKKFTKNELKELQNKTQEDGMFPGMNYDHYNTKDLAMCIGKNAGAMALQSVAITTGLTMASKIFNGETIEPNEIVENAIKTGADTSLKTITAGTLQVAIRKGIITIIPKTTPAGVIANIACVGIENAKVLGKIASGELSTTKGLDLMGRTTTSMIGGLVGMSKGVLWANKMLALVPVAGLPVALLCGFTAGTIGYLCGSEIGDKLYATGKKVAIAAKNVAKAAWNGVKSGVKKVGNTIKSIGKNFVKICF